MTTDAATTPDPTPDLTPEQQASADASAFTQGFDSVGKADSQDEPAAPSPQADSEEPAEAAKEDEEEPIPGLGFTASQMRTLLAKIPHVDKLEEQLQKAHGKIGELNRTLQELSQRPAPPAATPAADEGQSAEELEADYPDIARLVRLQIAKEKLAATPQDPGPAAFGLTAEQVERMFEERSMAQQHGEDWREAIVESDDYQLWLASQPDDYRERATMTPHARELAKVLDTYKTAKTTAADRAQRNKARLERSLTPEGVGGRPPAGPSEIDEFRAGFHSVRGG